MRICWRWIPGFTWVQIIVAREWKTGHWWAIRGFARTHAFGYLRICTMRSDAIERGKRSGIFTTQGDS